MTRKERAYDRALDLLIRRAFHQDPPGVLYHYTSLAGAVGIITTQEFWHTSHECTNDRHEIRSADEIIREMAAACMGGYGTLGDEAIRVALDIWTKLHVAAEFNIALACFSAAKDKPSQWSYADHGRGVSIGLRMLSEPAPAVLPHVGQHLGPVMYDENTAIDLLARGFHDVLTLSRRTKTSVETRTRTALALARLAGMLAILTKEPRWREEEEWRRLAIWTPDQPPHWLERGSASQTRYISVPIRHGAPVHIEEILLGPHIPDAAGAAKQLEEALAGAGYPSPSSGTPLPAIRQSGVGKELE
jgi:hypothetical protein